MRPSSSMQTVLWTVQMMIQAVEKDFMDPIENTDTHNCILTTFSTDITKWKPVHQGHAPIKHTSNQVLGIGNSIKGDTRYKVIKGSMRNRVHELRLNTRMEKAGKFILEMNQEVLTPVISQTST